MSEFEVNSPAWNDIKAVSVVGVPRLAKDASVLVETDAGVLTIRLYPTGARLSLGECNFDDYEMLVKEPKAEPLELSLGSGSAELSGAGHRLVLGFSPLSFELYKGQRRIQCSAKDGHFVRDFRLPPLAKVDQGWLVNLELGASEPVYGLGEKWGRLDKRGQLIRSFNHDALGVNAEISYKNSPFAWSPSGWGAFVHTPAPVTHGVGYAPWSQRAYSVLVEDDSLDLWLLSADQGAAMLEDYTALTGRAPVPPRWSLGTILSKAYYRDAEELLSTARAVREHQMPCDVITLDGRAWQDTDTRFAFEWDASRYPDPAVVLDQLKAMDFKICIWEYPLVSVEHPLFKTMSDKGWLLKDRRTGETYRYQWDTSCFGDVLTALPESGLVDFTHPEAYAFWRDSHQPLFDLGVDMIKADFGEQIEDDMLAYNGAEGKTLHNVYSLLYNRCVYEAAELYCKTGPFLFSRSSWTGCQRYPAQWGGDPQADWGGLAGSLRGGLSWGLTGAPYYATDVGGFYGDKRDAELYVRWTQAAVFSAHIRLHGIGPREPWSYGEQAQAAVEQALALRYRLIPYLQKTMQQASQQGLPVQRAMALSCPTERAAWAFEEQFMFGEHMLVAPCVVPGGEVEVYMPGSITDTWRNFFTGELYQSGRSYRFSLALAEMAVFVPAVVEIALGPDVQHTDELPA